MKWPWVSRLAYDAVVNERDWLRIQLQVEQNHNTRIERKLMGLPEISPVTRKAIPPMPETLAEKIRQWGDENIQIDLTNRANNMARAGKPWSQIEAKLDEYMGDT